MYSKKDNRVVLLPLDGSDNSERAFEWYAYQMHRKGDTAILVNIVEPVYATPPINSIDNSALSNDSVSQQMQDIIEDGKQLTQRFLHMAKNANIQAKAFIHIDSKPGPAVVKCAKEYHADVIVVGNRGVSKLRRTFLGSVSDFILQHAHLPIVIVPKEKVPDD